LPGFPKDYLCLFLGLTRMPVFLFVPLATFGRMPGTLMLSVQGSAVAGGYYATLVVVTVVCGLLMGLVYYQRQRLYDWLDRMNGNDSNSLTSHEKDAKNN